MEYRIANKKLIICDGTTEVGHRDICGILAGNEIEEVRLPETIERIHDDTFFDFPEIARINIPKGAQYIGAQAFWGLDALEELMLPTTVPFVGKQAFCNCKSLTLTILGSPTDIPSGWDAEFAANIKEIRFRKESISG